MIDSLISRSHVIFRLCRSSRALSRSTRTWFDALQRSPFNPIWLLIIAILSTATTGTTSAPILWLQPPSRTISSCTAIAAHPRSALRLWTPSSLPAPATMKVVCVSDTHGLHDDALQVPDGDVFVHAGDFTDTGERSEVLAFNEFLGRLPHQLQDRDRRQPRVVLRPPVLPALLAPVRPPPAVRCVTSLS